MPQLIVAAAYYVGTYLVNAYVGYALATVASYGLAKHQQRKAERAARDAYNASLQDRMQMVDITPNASAQLAYGRVRTVEGIRRRWTSGEHGEKLTLVISFAGHEIDGFETFYANDQPLALDGTGHVITAPYRKTSGVSQQVGVTLDEFGHGSYAIGADLVPGSVSASYQSGGDGDVPAILVEPSNVVQITGDPAHGVVSLNWQSYQSESFLRIRTWLGTDGQNVGAALHAEYPDNIKATDRFDGIALAVIDCLYDPDVYPQGLPNLTALLRGAKVLDTRTGVTAWSENNALIANHYARSGVGWAVPAEEIRAADISAAASICAVATDFPLRMPDGSLSAVSLPRYTCGITIDTAGDPRAAMDEIFESMAGRWGWAGGTWRMRAGHSAAPVFAMDPSWVAAPLDDNGELPTTPMVRLTNGVPRENKVNQVSGTCVNADERYQVLPFPAVSDPVLIAAEGEYPLTVEYQGVSHIAHAQQLGRIAIRSSQAALRMEASCNLSAWRCELFDVGTVTMPRYGFDAKLFEVLGWRWHPTQGVQLTTAETASAIFEVAELNGQDPAPNGDLPSLFDVPDLVLLSPQSGTVHLLRLQDGTVLSRLLVRWDPVTRDSVRKGGWVEIRYGKAGDPPERWQTLRAPGDDTQLYIDGVQDGLQYIITGRTHNSLVAGKWAVQLMHTVLGKAAPPSDATGFDHTPTSGGALIFWDACPDADYGSSELRVGATFAAAEVIWQGAASSYLWLAEVGTYHVWIVHQDTSGNPSTPVAQDVEALDISGGNAFSLQCTSQIFTQSGNNTFVPAAQTITFTALLGGLSGTATFTATRYDINGSVINTVVLGGSGNVRTLTQAQFNTAHYCVVTATLGAVSDQVTIQRVRDGSPVVLGMLTNEAALVAANSAGVVSSFAGTGGNFTVFRGLANLSLPGGGVTFAVESSSGIAITIGSTGDYAVTAMSTDSGSATLSATVAGVTISKQYKIAKVKPGADGDDGTNGLSSATVLIYQRSSTGAPALPSAFATYTFASATVSGLNNGWSAGIPGGTDPIYVSAAPAVSFASTDVIGPTEWAGVQLLAANGLNSATVYLYQRNNTGVPPAVPGATLTYTFSTGVLSGGSLSGWNQTIPAAGGNRYLFVTTAAALSASGTDTIATGEWAVVQSLAQDGAQGPAGPRVPGHWYTGGSSWSDAVADALVFTRTGTTPILTDIVTITNNVGYSETKYWYTGGFWVSYSNFISGGDLVDNAATSVYQDVYDFGGGGFGSVTARTFTITPTGNGVIEVSAIIGADNVYGDAGNGITWTATPSGGSPTVLLATSNNDSVRKDFSVVSVFPCTAGVPVTFAINVLAFVAIHLFKSTLRLAVIKK